MIKRRRHIPQGTALVHRPVNAEQPVRFDRQPARFAAQLLRWVLGRTVDGGGNLILRLLLGKLCRGEGFFEFTYLHTQRQMPH